MALTDARGRRFPVQPGEARALGALTRLFGNLLDEAAGGAAWLGMVPDDDPDREKRYLRARDAFRAEEERAKKAQPSAFTQGAVTGYVGQGLAALATGGWLPAVAASAASGAANRLGAEQSLPGEITDAGTLAVEGAKGFGVGLATGVAGQALARAPAIIAAAGRAGGKIAESGVGRAVKAVAEFADDFSPVKLRVPGTGLARKVVDYGRRQAAAPPAALASRPLAPLGAGPPGIASPLSIGNVIRQTSKAERAAEIAKGTAIAASKAVGDVAAASTASEAHEPTMDELMGGIESEPSMEELMQGVQ